MLFTETAWKHSRTGWPYTNKRRPAMLAVQLCKPPTLFALRLVQAGNRITETVAAYF
jgi:hypothetical protein